MPPMPPPKTGIKRYPDTINPTVDPKTGEVLKPQPPSADPVPADIVPDQGPVKPPTTLLYGDTGTGKTTAIATYVQAGLKVATLFTDPGGEESLIDGLERLKLPLTNVHWAYIPPRSFTWQEFEEAATKVSLMTYQALTAIKTSGKRKDTQYMKVISLLRNFICSRTGEQFGPVDELDDTWAFAMDSVSGLNIMSLDMMIGTKPSAHEGEYGVAMNMEEKLITMLVGDCKCFVCMTAHPDKQTSEITGMREVLPQFLGKKLAPRTPRIFSDVILTKKDAMGNFTWSTLEGDTVLKHRNVAMSDKLEPSFVPIVKRYHERKAAASAAPTQTIKEVTA